MTKRTNNAKPKTTTKANTKARSKSKAKQKKEKIDVIELIKAIAALITGSAALLAAIASLIK